MGTLYQIDKNLLELLERGFNEDCINLETGEIDEDKAQEFLNNLPIERNQKLENYGLIIKNLSAESDAIKAEEKKLADRRQQKERLAERLKNNITASMVAFKDSKIETAKICFTLRKSQQVEIEENAVIPSKYLTIKITETPNKAELKKALASGEVISGVSIVEKQNLQLK